MFYKVLRPNPFYKVGTYLEDDPSGFVQQVYVSREAEHYEGPAGYFGLLYPLHEVRPYVVEIRKKGLDKYEGGALS